MASSKVTKEVYKQSVGKKHLLFFCCPVVVIIDINGDVKPVELVQADNWKHAVLDKLIRLLITAGI